jgi:hypothetical protein
MAFLTEHFFRLGGENIKARDGAVGLGAAEAKKRQSNEANKVTVRRMVEYDIDFDAQVGRAEGRRGRGEKPRLRIQQRAKPLLVLEERTWRWGKPTTPRTECPSPTAFSF